MPRDIPALESEIDIPPQTPLSRVAETIESACAAEGLRAAQRGPLTTHPGSLHWHWKRGRDTGTLEITLLNRERRVQIHVRANRTGTWTEDAFARIEAAIADQASA